MTLSRTTPNSEGIETDGTGAERFVLSPELPRTQRGLRLITDKTINETDSPEPPRTQKKDYSAFLAMPATAISHIKSCRVTIFIVG